MQDFGGKDLPQDDEIEISDLDTPDERKQSSVIYRIMKRVRSIPISARTRTILFVLAVLLGGSILAYPFIPFLHAKKDTVTTSYVASYISSSANSLTGQVINVMSVNGVAYIFTEDGTLSAQQASDGKLLWRVKTSTPASQPIVADNLIFLASQNSQSSHVDALRASDGALQWTVQIPSLASSGPLLVQNAVAYVLSQDGTVYALNANNGHLLWKFATGITNEASNGVVYALNGITAVRTSKQIVYLLHTHDGSQILHYTMNPPSTPASWYPGLENDIVYIHTNTNSLQARLLSDGSLLWQYAVEKGWGWSSVTQNGIVYVYALKVGSSGGALRGDGLSLRALSSYDGSLLWQHSGISGWYGQQAGLIFVTHANGSIEALRVQDGSRAWQYKPSRPNALFWYSTATAGILYISTNAPDRAIFALRSSDGHLLWQRTLNNTDFMPDVTGTALYLWQTSDSIDVVRNSDGHSLWHYTTPTPIMQDIVADGVVYMMQEDGTITVLHAQDGKVAWSYAP